MRKVVDTTGSGVWRFSEQEKVPSSPGDTGRKPEVVGHEMSFLTPADVTNVLSSPEPVPVHFRLDDTWL